MAKAIEYHIIDEFDNIFDEKGNTFLSLRKICWGDNDPEKAKLDLRKWFINANGEETVGKGVSFLTDEGPNNLTRILVENGFGHTSEILDGIKDRDDFRLYLNNILDKNDKHYDDTIKEDLYDPKDDSIFDY